MSIPPENEFVIKTAYCESAGELEFVGALHIQHAKEIREALIDALSRRIRLTITCRNPLHLDLAVLQLFIAAKKCAADTGTELTFNLRIPVHLQSLLSNSGIDKHITLAS